MIGMYWRNFDLAFKVIISALIYHNNEDKNKVVMIIIFPIIKCKKVYVRFLILFLRFNNKFDSLYI